MRTLQAWKVVPFYSGFSRVIKWVGFSFGRKSPSELFSACARYEYTQKRSADFRNVSSSDHQSEAKLPWVYGICLSEWLSFDGISRSRGLNTVIWSEATVRICLRWTLRDRKLKYCHFNAHTGLVHEIYDRPLRANSFEFTNPLPRNLLDLVSYLWGLA